ncbi:right-handed parallel beta-helix repeat-containing protein [Cryptosporangium japonicum]|uniref:Right handed beta helix domain-containing protein n=1 Tax=Cryptosporangium japonicum TaxID=80872 RepID=A0ABP3DNF0_9ACTN
MTTGSLPAEPASAAGQVYYVSPTGSDQANGLSAGTAWRTLNRANQQTFRPGDQLLLAGGSRFIGPLRLGVGDSGTAQDPLTVSSYGTGRATVAGEGTEAIVVYNAANVSIRDLVLVGSASSYQAFSGISAYSDQPSARVARLRVSGVDVSGFKEGIAIGGRYAGAGFEDVLIEGVSTHDNRDAGILTYGPSFDAVTPRYAHAGVRVTGVTAYRNLGNRANLTSNSGSGIVLGSVEGGTIEDSTAYDNGAACVAPEGPVGIWAYDSRDIVIQRNLSYRNRSGGSADGGGFDLDQNVRSSVLQYNLSYQNDGPGLMVFTAQPNDATTGNVVRFNISVDDATGRGQYGAITVAGRITATTFHHNTVVIGALGPARQPVVKLGEGFRGLNFSNNILVSLGEGLVVAAMDTTPAQAFFTGNAYYRSAGGLLWAWGRNSYDNLAAWRTGAGQEVAAGAATGFVGDPVLAGLRTAPTITAASQLRTVVQYLPGENSPVSRVAVTNTTADTTASTDFFGRTTTEPWRWAGAARP